MPQASQIIPSHSYPYNEVVINDNTVITPERSADSDDSIQMLFVFSSPKGPTKLTTIEGGLSEFVDTYGQGICSVYGQPYLNAYNAFNTGSIVGHCLRVVADNATYAYSNLVALYKVDDQKMTVKFKTRSGESTLKSLDNIDELYTSPVEAYDDGDDNGFQEVKLMTIVADGKGSYGKKLRYGISSDANSDKSNNYKNYIFSVYEQETSLQTKGSYPVCFVEYAVVDGESKAIDSVVNDPTTGSKRIQTVTYYEGFQKLFDAYKDANPTTSLTIETFDALLGINKNTKAAIENYEIDTTSEDVVVLNSVSGIALESGDDGDLAETADAEVRKSALEAAYLKAWNGTTDERIKSKNQFPVHLILDADYPIACKQQILALTSARKDCMCVIDCGTGIKTKRSPITYVKENLDGYSTQYVHMIDGICGKVRDPFTKKLVTVTDTALLAAAYPINWATNAGKHVPVAGNTYGILDGFIKDSIYPLYDEAIDSAIMDELCDERINFARVNNLKQTVRATQTTRQTVVSKLSEANNVFVLLDIKRDCEELCNTYQYNFAEANDIARFNRDAETVLEKYSAAQVRSIEASFDKNDYEAARNIIHLYVGFVNKDIVKTVITEIDVNNGSTSE